MGTEHLHGFDWPVRLYSLKKNIKNAENLRGIARHLVAEAQHPTLLCGIHLCGTLALRAVQLYNQCSLLGVCGLALVPCCLPPGIRRPQSRGGLLRWKRLYVVDGFGFDAIELEPRGQAYVFPSALGAGTGSSDTAEAGLATNGSDDADVVAGDQAASASAANALNELEVATNDANELEGGEAHCGGASAAAPRFARFVHRVFDCLVAGSGEKRLSSIPVHRTKAGSGNYCHDWYIFARQPLRQLDPAKAEEQIARPEFGAPVVNELGWVACATCTPTPLQP